MSSTATRALLACLTVLVLVSLAACSGGGTSTERTRGPETGDPVRSLEKGTCWGAEQLPDALGAQGFEDWVRRYGAGKASARESMRDDAAFSDRVDCTDPHALELFDTVALDPRLDAKVTDYADLLETGSALYRQVRDEVYGRCLASTTYGAAQRRAGGLAVQLGPSLNPDAGLHVAWDPFPAHLWARGQRRFVCTFEQDDPTTLMFTDLATRATPVSARVCVNTPRTYVPCRTGHQAEDIGEMTLNTAVAQGRLPGRTAVRTGSRGRYVALSDAQYAGLDRICRTLLDRVSTVRGGVTARAYLGSADMWPDDSGSYLASCFALKPYDPPPKISGTVFDRVR